MLLVNVRLQCLGPPASAVKYGKLISVYVADDNSILAFSAASLTLYNAILSLEISTPEEVLKSFMINSYKITSTSSPPHEVSPFVDLTSKTPLEISKIEISKVPPPKS